MSSTGELFVILYDSSLYCVRYTYIELERYYSSCAQRYRIYSCMGFLFAYNLCCSVSRKRDIYIIINNIYYV